MVCLLYQKEIFGIKFSNQEYLNSYQKIIKMISYFFMIMLLQESIKKIGFGVRSHVLNNTFIRKKLMIRFQI